MNHPMQVAAALAAQLRADPIAAAQIHEHVPATELLDLLNLRAAMAEHVEEMVEHAVAAKQEEIDRLQDIVDECFDCSEAAAR
jgi:hypothetical protein